jgi:hypothetical protein
MTELTKDALCGAAGTLHDALSDSARDLETETPVSGHNHRMTLVIVAGACFILGFLWAKTRTQTF